MSSIREQIIARMVVVLAALNVASVAIPIYRSREDAFARNELPAVVLRPSDEETQALSEVLEMSTLNIHLEIIVRGSPWDALADPIVSAAHQLLMDDAVLVALFLKMRRSGAKWEAQEADQTAGVLMQTYRITYVSQTNQL
jgi:hypothetical protein